MLFALAALFALAPPFVVRCCLIVFPCLLYGLCLLLSFDPLIHKALCRQLTQSNSSLKPIQYNGAGKISNAPSDAPSGGPSGGPGPLMQFVVHLNSTTDWNVIEKFRAKAAFYLPYHDDSGWNSTAGVDSGGEVIVQVHRHIKGSFEDIVVV